MNPLTALAVVAALPPFHAWVPLSHWQPGTSPEQPQATVIVCVLPHLGLDRNANVWAGYGYELPPLALREMDAAAYDELVRQATAANDAMVQEWNARVIPKSPPPKPPPPRIPGDYNNDGVVNTQDFFDFLADWSPRANQPQGNDNGQAQP